MTTCPEIASQGDSDIELSTYERSNGTTVVIGCTGFGRHIAGPELVECLETGAWSKTPDLKCEFGLDSKEKVIVGAAAVSAALVLITLLCICCYCCCCRRRHRRYHRHRYHDWRDSDDNWKDYGSSGKGGWSGWTSRWFGRSGDNKDFRSSSHYQEYTSGPSKTFVNESGYSRGDRDKGNSFSKKTGFFRRSRRFSDGDKHSIDREMFPKKRSGKFSDADKHSVHRQDFLRKSNFLQDSGKYSDIDKHSYDKLAYSKKSDFLKQSGKYSDADRQSLHRQDYNKSSNFMRQSGWHSDRNRYPDVNRYPDEGRRKGWRGWTDSLRENWIDWRSRTFGDSPADGSVRRHDRNYDSSSIDRGGYREGYGGYSQGNRADVIESKRQPNDDFPPPEDFRRGRRYSDSSLVAQQQRYSRREASYGSRLDDVHYSRSRRYSDPMIYRSEYSPYRQEVSRDSRIVSSDEKPSFNIIRYNDSRHRVLEREPRNFEYTNKPIVQYSGTETERYMDNAQILDPVYYKDPNYYTAESRNNGVVHTGGTHYNEGAVLYSGGALLDGGTRYSGGAILGGQTSYSGGALLGGGTHYSGGAILDGQTRVSGGLFADGKMSKYTTKHANTDGLMRLPPITLDQFSKMVNVNGLNRSHSARVVSSPRVLELEGNKHVTNRIVGNDIGLTGTGHYELLTANPSAGAFERTRAIPIETSTLTGGHYTLYQGKGKTRKFHNL